MKWFEMIFCVDLPNLTSIINSQGWSFCNPRSVTLESISKYWILILFRHSKSSKCQSAWFIRGSSIEINFEYWLFVWFDFIQRGFSHSRWSSLWTSSNKRGRNRWSLLYWFREMLWHTEEYSSSFSYTAGFGLCTKSI